MWLPLIVNCVAVTYLNLKYHDTVVKMREVQLPVGSLPVVVSVKSVAKILSSCVRFLLYGCS